MNDRESRLGEITALAASIIVGGIIMVVGRLPLAYGIAPLSLTAPEDWLRTNYNPAAITAFLTSALAAIAWYLIALKWWTNYKARQQAMQARLIWILLGILAVASVVLGIIIWGNEEGASLQIFSFIIFVVTLSLSMMSSYWLATVLSTPINMVHIIPLSHLFRR